jgi:NIMA-interacting peptidyl-prolyl cis-trans isomerase 1
MAARVRRQLSLTFASTHVHQIEASHILCKHRDSRRPSSWRKEKIEMTKEEAIKVIEGGADVVYSWHVTRVVLGFKNPYQSFFSCCCFSLDHIKLLKSGEVTFSDLARTESDCSSAKRGGDLGPFKRGMMQSKSDRVKAGRVACSRACRPLLIIWRPLG